MMVLANIWCMVHVVVVMIGDSHISVNRSGSLSIDLA